MKKGIIFTLLIVFLMFADTSIVSASSSYGKPFGGRIIDTKAAEIRNLQNNGFICGMEYFGTSVEILPIGSPVGTPTSYYIYNYVLSKSKIPLRTGQGILGKYFGNIPEVCIKGQDIRFVWLDIIILFGTSK